MQIFFNLKFKINFAEVKIIYYKDIKIVCMYDYYLPFTRI